MPRRRAAAAVLAALALAAAGCGGDSEGDAGIPNEREAQGEAVTPEPATEGGDLQDTSVKPEVQQPEGEPPEKLVVEDIVDGKGPRAKAGDTITVHYVGVSWSTGEQFDASWDAGQPFPFELGGGRVIPGWDEGLVGMRAGGRRKLVIPPDMAYGESGFPPDIAPNETLVFVVDLLEIS